MFKIIRTPRGGKPHEIKSFWSVHEISILPRPLFFSPIPARVRVPYHIIYTSASYIIYYYYNHHNLPTWTWRVLYTIYRRIVFRISEDFFFLSFIYCVSRRESLIFLVHNNCADSSSVAGGVPGVALLPLRPMQRRLYHIQLPVAYHICIIIVAVVLYAFAPGSGLM